MYGICTESRVKNGQVIYAVTGVSTFKDSVICRTGKMAQKNIFQCFGVAAQDKNTRGEGGGASVCYAQIVERLSIVSYASSVLDTFENMKHRKK